MGDIGKITHSLKNSQGRCVVGAFDFKNSEGCICTGHRDF